MQIQTTTQSSVNQQGRSQEDTPRNQPLPQTKALTIKTPMTSESYFTDKRQLLHNSRFDKRLTPATQLLYRVLMDLLNINRWLHPVVVSNEELKQLTRISSNDEITRAKQRLQSLGYIEFSGKPSNYIIYSPPVYKPVQQTVQKRTHFNESTIQREFFKKEETSKKKEGAKRDIHDAILDTDWANSPELDELLS